MITHPNLPKGKEQVTLLCQDFSQSIQPMNISPLSFSPVGEMQVTLTIDSLLIIRQQEYLSLPYYYICKKNKRDKISLIT